MALPKCSLSLTTNMIMNVTSFPEFENDELGCTESFPLLGPICPSFPTISQNIQHELDIASKQLRLSFINSKRCEFQYMKKLFKPNLNLKSPSESTPKSTKINNSISKRKAEEKFICPVGFCDILCNESECSNVHLFRRTPSPEKNLQISVCADISSPRSAQTSSSAMMPLYLNPNSHRLIEPCFQFPQRARSSSAIEPTFLSFSPVDKKMKLSEAVFLERQNLRYKDETFRLSGKGIFSEIELEF